MSINRATEKLMHGFESLRLKAYPDPATKGPPWTIGWGHTSAAGAPRVKAGMKITRVEANAIFKRDVAQFEAVVDDAVTVPLNENQRGALVSFCFNVGPGNFRKSSVLRYVNKGDFDKVPSRLLLWNKAAGKVMRGLTRRRQAEGVLFMTPITKQIDQAQIEEQAHVQVEPNTGKSAIASNTNKAAVGLGTITATSVASHIDTAKEYITPVIEPAKTFFGDYAIPVLAVIVVGLVAYIIYSRRKKSQEGL